MITPLTALGNNQIIDSGYQLKRLLRLTDASVNKENEKVTLLLINKDSNILHVCNLVRGSHWVL